MEVERAGSLPDTSTPGLYRIAYKVFASETFYRTYFRYVNVRDFSTIATDLSGEYHNSPDAITITKIYDGFYTASDTWWQPAGPIPVTFYDCGNGEFLIIEPQSSIFRPVYNDGFSYYTPSPATIEFNLGIPSQGAYYTTLWTK
ncbi:MAG: hypothetical protein LUD76_05690 [Alistipes sp.]|nr:hypothetical protein [Alistipes sp.]